MPRTRKPLAEHLAPFTIAREATPDRPWIVEGLLRRGEITVLAGHPKDGKTCLAAALATAVARGANIAGLKTERADVLYLAAEEGPGEWRHGPYPHLTKVCTRRLKLAFASLPIDREEGIAILREATRNVGLLVVDPLLAAVECLTVDRYAAHRNALAPLHALCVETGLAALVVHHATRPRQACLRTHPHRTLFLEWRPVTQGRRITLRPARLCFLSRNPGHYEIASTATRQNSVENRPKVPAEK